MDGGDDGFCDGCVVVVLANAFVARTMSTDAHDVNLLCAHKSREFADGYVLMSPLCTSADPRSARRYAHVRVLRVLWMLFPI